MGDNFKQKNMQFDRKPYMDKLIAHRHNHLVKVVTGVRRSGKSYLLFTLYYEYLRSDGVDDNHIIGMI